MTIDIRTGKPILYECPECKRMSRGLMNGKCADCNRETVLVGVGGGESSAASRFGVSSQSVTILVADLSDIL